MNAIRLIGGEMLVWSDLSGEHGPGPVRAGALAPLVSATAQGRTLVAGPHDPDLIDALRVEALTLLVRGVPDAEALASRYGDRPGVTVCCGGLEKLPADNSSGTDGAFDTVIALDGPSRLSSVEGRELGWGEALTLLLSAVRPGGRLLLGVENLLGLHRLAALPPGPTDSDWAAPGEYDRARLGGLAGVRARLGAAGLAVARTYAAYPVRLAPTALLSAELLADEGVRGFVEATVSRACVPTSDVLTDPARIAVSAVRHGAPVELAPAWVVVAHRDAPALEPPGAELPAPKLPDALELPDTLELPDALVNGAEVRREAMPPGRTLEDLLLGALLRHDLPAARDLLDAWRSDSVAGVPTDQVIVGPDGRLTGLVPPGTPEAALRALASALPGEDLATTLTAMTGVEPAPADQQTRGLRELRIERDRLARELAEARAQAEWYEREVAARDEELARAQRTIELLGATGPARAGKAFLGGVRMGRRTARSVVRRFRPRA